MTDPILKPIGDSVFVVWRDRAVIEFSRVSEHRDSLSAEVTVSNAAGTSLHWARVNLASTQGRGALVKAVEEAEPTDDWRPIIEQSCRLVAQHIRTGEPAVPLVAEPPHDARWAVEGWLPAGQITVLYGDGGCIASGTTVATARGEIPVDRLDGPASVWALGPSGPVLTPAIIFRKGWAPLLRVSLDDGRSVDVTAEHRFLTDHGWLRADACAPGQRLAGCARGRPATTPGTDHGAWPLGEPHWTRTTAGFPGHCWMGLRRYDPRPPTVRESAQVFVPSRVDALAHIQRPFDWDDRAISPRYSRSRPSLDRLARSNFAPVAAWQASGGFLRASSRATRRSDCTPGPWPCPQDSAWPHDLGSSQSEAAAAVALCSLPSVYHATVTAVTKLPSSPYWDVQVPGYENYLANGLWHHNSGKSYLALTLALSGLLDRAITPRWRMATLHRVMYLDWETDQAAQRARLWRLTQGLGSEPPDGAILHRTMRRPLRDEILAVRAEVARLGVDFVVCDSLAPASGPEPEHADAALSALLALRSLAVTALCIAHVNKVQADSKAPARPFGSVHIQNLARSTIEARGSEADAEGESTVSLYHRKLNDGRRQAPSALRFTFDPTGPIRVSGGEPDIGGASLVYQVLSELRRGERGAVEIAEALDAPPAAVKKTLQRLEQRDKVCRLGERKDGAKRERLWGLADTRRDSHRDTAGTPAGDEREQVPF